MADEPLDQVPHKLLLEEYSENKSHYHVWFWLSDEKASTSDTYQTAMVDVCDLTDALFFFNGSGPSHMGGHYVPGPIRELGKLGKLEARLYVVDRISDKLRKCQLRSIKRLADRYVIEFRYNQWLVVLFKAGSLHGEALHPSTSVEAITQEHMPGKEYRLQGLREKSDTQREKDRLRQSERRKNRRKERQQNKLSDGNENETREVNNPETTDEEEALYVLLHLAYNRRPELRQQLPSFSRTQLENYLQRQPIKFEDENDMKDFMAIKLREVVFLNRQEKKLPVIELKRKTEYAKLMNQLSGIPKKSAEYESMQERVTLAQGKLRVIRHVQEVIPIVITDAERVVQDIKRALKLIRSIKEDMEQCQALKEEWQRLKRRLMFCENMTKEIVPGSEPYAYAISKLVEADAKLKQFEAGQDDGITISMLESKQFDLEDLSIGLMRDTPWSVAMK